MKKIYIFSPTLRISRWIWALSITFLFISGIYIGNPFFLGPTGIEMLIAQA